MWFAKNNLCKVFREDSQNTRSYIPIDSDLYKKKYGSNENLSNIQQAYFMSSNLNPNIQYEESYKQKKNRSTQLSQSFKSKNSITQKSLSNLKDQNYSNIIKNPEDFNDNCQQAISSFAITDIKKQGKSIKTSSQLDHNEEQKNTLHNQNSSLLKLRDTSKDKQNNLTNYNEFYFAAQGSKQDPFDSLLQQNQEQIEPRNQSHKKQQSQRNLEISLEHLSKKKSFDFAQRNGNILSSSRLATEEKTNNNSNYYQIYNNSLKTEISSRKESLSNLFFNTSRKSLDNLNFSKYINFIENKREKTIKNIIEKEIEQKENGLNKNLIQLPSLKKSQSNLNILQQLLTPRANPYPSARNCVNVVKNEEGNFNQTEKIIQKVPKLNTHKACNIQFEENLSQFQYFQKINGKEEKIESPEKNNDCGYQDSKRSQVSLGDKQNENKLQFIIQNNQTPQMHLPKFNADPQQISQNQLHSERKMSSRSNSRNQNKSKKSQDIQEHKKEVQKEKQKQHTQYRIEHFRQIILKNDYVKRDVSEISDYLEYLLSQTDISKKQIKKQINIILQNTHAIQDLFFSDNNLVINASAAYYQQFIIQELIQENFLQKFLNKEDILKEVILPDLYIFRDKLTQYCRNRQQNHLRNIEQTILLEQSTINNIELNRFYSNQNNPEKILQTNFTTSNQFLSDFIYPNEPLLAIDKVERKLGNFNLVKHSGRIHSYQITNALKALKEKKKQVNKIF
ncbi:hypothetical protein TTHERM_00697280 (macronuclear) [Tetrahymena thermophila SB210]|uniref:Uncharacterized protein n=1 Tax=Tetrahymena thermophila (strain SB210) TaxID=312017 RepID=Q24C44_TETTS|nr:hypothetical protein TTHERM_00697280 [Tetrahymena thermophila SB210]EAS05394.2 hypothetical protein TTHERM_00697280 [Tetrahymena thermophila SB210]|eukprot:XP_001025639.2 hypothetical protein TTHERM_00697280 [Tetrahymena thermophila SB210]